MRDFRLSKLSDCVVFFDFDNTITPFDVCDDIIKRFSINEDWIAPELAWQKGKIGSARCLSEQLKSVRISKDELGRYLSQIKIDPYFHRIIGILKKDGLKPVILSDSFTFIINTILRDNGVTNAEIYANDLRFGKDRLMPSFPNRNPRCNICAHCKKKSLLRNKFRDKIIMYVGDGLSDICPALYSHMVFAKGELLRHFRRTKRLCIAYRNLEDIYNYFRGLDR